MMGARKPGPQGDREAAVKTIAQGRPGSSGWTCGTCRLHFFPQAGHGPQSRSGLPCALYLKRANEFAKLGRESRREDVSAYLAVRGVGVERSYEPSACHFPACPPRKTTPLLCRTGAPERRRSTCACAVLRLT
ncbi:hypothetical protein BRAS3843_3100005 [Bradyrhizobium sp. STM 3843]|nr:hypothetical protein BRAS3843_3100005 [Bradyrhizobium sp. STM 3843]